MSQLFINIIGHNGSGKTTIAKQLEQELKLNRVSGDDFRDFLAKNILYFHRTSFSYPSEKSRFLRPVVFNYRYELAAALLEAGEHVINDGSGATRELRARYLKRIKQTFPGVTTILIWIDIPEEELLKRLMERDNREPNARWVDMYHDIRKAELEPPAEDEADLILHYDQQNYKDILSAIRERL